MMNVLDQATNFEPLKKAIDKAEKEILICSAWIRGETLQRVLSEPIQRKIKQGDISLKIIIRIGDRSDIEISGLGLFQFVSELGSHCELRYHKTLHTKLYVVDDIFAMIGSFNLTGGGFGTQTHPGNNIEGGIAYKTPEEVASLKKKFEAIWETEATPIDPHTVGFVLSNATEREFHVVGIRPLESGMFVTVAQELKDTKAYLLGQISEVYQMNSSYYVFPSEGSGIHPLMQKAFGNPEPLSNLASGIAEKHMAEEANLHLAKVKVKSRITQTPGGGIHLETNRFAPPVAEKVEKASKELLEGLYSHAFCRPAVLVANPEVEIGLDPEKILRQHMAVFGSTGSGKSYFVKQLIKNYLKPWMDSQKGRIIILDPHGEYAEGKDFDNVIPKSNCIPNPSDSSLASLESKVVEDVDDLIDACDLSKPNRAQREYLQNMLYKANKSTENFMNELQNVLTRSPTSSGTVINWKENLKKEFEDTFLLEIPGLQKLVKNLMTLRGEKNKESEQAIREELFNKFSPEEQEKIKQAVLAKYSGELETLFTEKTETVLPPAVIDTILHCAHRKAFRLEPYHFIQKVEQPGIYCVDMRLIHDEEQRLELAGDILREVFHKAKESIHDPFKTLFVIEEAHNFAPEPSTKSNPAYKYMVKIAREGRKFGVGLLVISQRPAYVSKDVLAQCNSQAIFRLINPNDLKAVEAIVEGISAEELYKLPHYQTGQCIFTGIAIKEPVVVTVKSSISF